MGCAKCSHQLVFHKGNECFILEAEITSPEIDSIPRRTFQTGRIGKSRYFNDSACSIRETSPSLQILKKKDQTVLVFLYIQIFLFPLMFSLNMHNLFLPKVVLPRNLAQKLVTGKIALWLSEKTKKQKNLACIFIQLCDC